MNWDDLRTFLAIARHRTLSGAARAVGVRQPTMGRRLEAMQARIGTRLLLKTPSGYRLTAAGEAVLAAVERIETEALGVERLIAGQDERLEGVVRLATIETLATEILAPAMAQFQAAHPAVRIELVVGPGSLSLIRREADVALRVAPFTQPGVVAQRVGRLEHALYAAEAYVARHGVPDWTAGARGHAVVFTEADLMTTPEMVWFGGVAGEARVALVSNNRAMHRAAVQEGMGIACLARYLGDATPGLVRLLPAPATVARDLWLGVHEDMRATPRIRAFTAAIRAALAAASPRLAPSDRP